MNDTGPLASPPRETGSREERIGEVDPRAAALLEDQPLPGVPVEQLRDRVPGLEDEARRGQRALGQPGVQPHRRRERRPLREHERRNLVAQHPTLGSPVYVTCVLCPRSDCLDDALDQRPHRALRRGARRTREVAASDDRDRQVRPADRRLDLARGERDPPVGFGELHGALGPLHEFERIRALVRQVSSDERRPRGVRRS